MVNLLQSDCNNEIYGVIYITTNTINGMKYIGQTTQLTCNYLGSGVRLLKDIKYFGKSNFLKKVLCYCYNAKQLHEMEKHYIWYYGAKNSNLFYNIMGGGGVAKNGKDRHIVCKYDYNGNFIKEYNKVRQAANDNNIAPASIYKNCNGLEKSAGKFQFRYAYSKAPGKLIQTKVELKNMINGSVLEFYSKAKAAAFLGIPRQKWCFYSGRVVNDYKIDILSTDNRNSRKDSCIQPSNF